MAITINGGTGVITGVSVGGLPDGIVDSGTLATNSVDSAELIDGAVDDSHMAAMAASKLTGALPAISGASLTGISGGKILQHKLAAGTHPQTYNNSITNSTEFLSTTFTPTASDSTILLQFSMAISHEDTSDGYFYGAFYRGATQVHIGLIAVAGPAANAQIQQQESWYMMHIDNPGTTSELTYKVIPYYNVSPTSSHYYISCPRILIMELAPN